MNHLTPQEEAFERVRMSDRTVSAMLRAGRPLEEIVVALVAEKNQFMDRIMQLAGIAPRRITLPDGRVMVWRCPDHLVPETLFPDPESGQTPIAPDEGRP